MSFGLNKMADIISRNERKEGGIMLPDGTTFLQTSEAILLTGATGFLGSYLLSSLLQKDSEARIFCLVRGENEAHGLRRIKEALLSYDLSIENLSSRVEVVLGDLAHDRFGLTKSVYEKLAGQVDLIFHSGAAINWLGSYESLAEINVEGTKRVIEFSNTDRIKTLHYISTTAIYYSLDIVKHGYLNKEVGLEGFSRHIIGYFKTKWVAEQLVQEAFDAGLPGIITRPTFISGTLKSGYLPENDLTRLFLIACLDCGGIPDIDLFVDAIPVDIVAAAILNVATFENPSMRTYNISNPAGISLNKLGTVAEAIGLPVRLCSHEEWQLKLKQGHQTPPQRILRKLTRAMPGAENGFLNFLAEADYNVEDIDTDEALVGTGIVCPELNEDILMTYMGGILFNTKIAAE